MDDTTHIENLGDGPTPPASELPAFASDNLSIEDKIKKIISSYKVLKERYAILKEDYEKTVTNNIELEDEKTQWQFEKGQLMQKVSQLEEELTTQEAILGSLQQQNTTLNTNTKAAIERIDNLIIALDAEY